MLAKLSISHIHREKVRYSPDRWWNGHSGQIRRGSFSNRRLCRPPASFSSKRRDFLHQGWTTQTRLDRQTGGDRRLWPLQWRKASWVRRKKVRRALFFSEGMNHGCGEVRRAGAARYCFHGYSPNMRLLLLRRFRSHALSRPTSSEEKTCTRFISDKRRNKGSEGRSVSREYLYYVILYLISLFVIHGLFQKVVIQLGTCHRL